MSNKSGSLPELSLPTQPDFANEDSTRDWLIEVTRELNQWAFTLTEKVKEIESISVDGQGLNLTIYPATATLTKRDGVVALFSGDPTGGAGGAGLYQYVAATDTWFKL